MVKQQVVSTLKYVVIRFFGKAIKNKKFVKGAANASYLAIGNILGELITFFSFLIVARDLGPIQYGVYSTVTNYTSIFELFTLNGLHKVLVREGSKDPSQMKHVINDVIGIRWILVSIAMVICIISATFSPYETEVKYFIYLYSVTILSHSLSGILTTIYQANQKMHIISIFNVSSRIVFSSLVILALKIGFGLETVLIINIAVNFITFIVSLNVARKFANFNLLSKFKFHKDYLSAGFTFSLFSIVTIMATKFDLLIISVIGNQHDVGVYSVAFKIASIGILLRNLNADAFFPIFVQRFNEGTVSKKMIINYSLMFFVVIFVLTSISAIFCTDIIVLVFGQQYYESGKILTVLLFYLAFPWGTLPFTIAAQATYQEKTMLYVRIWMAAANIVLDYVLFLWLGLIGIAWGTLIVWGIGSILMCYYPYKKMVAQGYLK